MNNAAALNDKRVNLIRAVEDLGIDRYSVCSFLKSSIEAERNCLEISASLIAPSELTAREHALIEAELIRLTLEHF